MTAPYYATGNTHRFRATLQKDGVPWDISAAAVTVVFRQPDGTEFTREAEVENGPGGIASYVTVPIDPGPADLLVAGDWSLYFRVVDGSLDLATEPYGFRVHPR